MTKNSNLVKTVVLDSISMNEEPVWDLKRMIDPPRGLASNTYGLYFITFIYSFSIDCCMETTNYGVGICGHF